MRYAIDIRHLTHPRPSGVGLYTLNVLRVLSRIAHDDEFVLFASGSKKTLDRLPGLPSRNMTLVQRAIPNRALFALIASGLPMESLLGTSVDAWWFPEGTIVCTRLPYALTVHDIAIDLFPQFFTAKDRMRHRIADTPRVAARAHCVLAASESTALDVAARWGVNRNRIVVTPLGINAQYTARIAPSDRNYQRGYGLSTPYILFLATLEPRKNIETIIEAYDEARNAGVVLPRLVLAGGEGWKADRIRATVAMATHRNDIAFLGYVHEKHKPALYRGASALIFPSFYEGFGLPVLEAMASGTPVITSFAGSLPEVGGDAVIYVDPLNVSDLTLALAQLFDQKDGTALRTLLIDRGVRRAREFTWEKTAEATLDALHQLSS